jgi:hypothetical protein
MDAAGPASRKSHHVPDLRSKGIFFQPVKDDGVNHI